jgi:hypothetical protein
MSRLDNVRAEFEARISSVNDFANRCALARHASVERPALRKNHLEWVHEAALLKLFVSSEQFYETAFGLYAIGERTSSGYRARRLKRLRITLPSILEVFRGDQNYVGWNDSSTIIRRAERWLKNGEPFQTPLSAASQLLGFLRTMRNAIAHESESASEKYRDAVRKIYGAVPNRLSPGAQLLELPPAGIPYLAGASLFEATISSFRLIAAGVVR